MSWRDNLRATTETVSRSDKSFQIHGTTYDVEFLLSQIGDRDAVVDACLPPQLAEDLRRRNINAVWVPAILGDGVSDDEIERQTSNWRRAIVGEQKKTKSATDARCAILTKTQEPSHLGKIPSID